jgi:hypothetical protein
MRRQRNENNAPSASRDPPRIQTGSRERRKAEKSRERTVETIQEKEAQENKLPERQQGA